MAAMFAALTSFDRAMTFPGIHCEVSRDFYLRGLEVFACIVGTCIYNLATAVLLEIVWWMAA